MGCFSYLCKECGKGILSNSFKGEMVKLFYIKDGKVIEMMEGEYDSYGRVFIDGTQCKGVKHPLRDSLAWKHQKCISASFSELDYAMYLAHRDIECRQMYEDLKVTDPDRADYYLAQIQTEPRPIRDDWGIAAVHSRCFKENPTTISELDPNQGWGDDGELFGNVDDTLDVEKCGESV